MSTQSQEYAAPKSRERRETGSPWRRFSLGRMVWAGLAISLLIGVGCLFVGLWYPQLGGEAEPYSIVGLASGVLGTSAFLLAAFDYAHYRRRSKRVPGGLRISLQRHVAFTLATIPLVLLHAFGHYSFQLSGTYLLIALLLLLCSGLVGKAIQIVLPRLIVAAVDTALTDVGEDRLASVTPQLQVVPVQMNSEEGFPSGEIASLLLGPKHLMLIVQDVSTATRRERRYRLALRLWREIHILLAWATLGFLLWHLLAVIPVLRAFW